MPNETIQTSPTLRLEGKPVPAIACQIVGALSPGETAQVTLEAEGLTICVVADGVECRKACLTWDLLAAYGSL